MSDQIEIGNEDDASQSLSSSASVPTVPVFTAFTAFPVLVACLDDWQVARPMIGAVALIALLFSTRQDSVGYDMVSATR